ncbi:cytochrome c5 family protein [Geothermobacter hydrogeniphilus]|uniref:Cytochrome c5 family protein n=1 Tax=Geothermobacter hydrogeniphilus TaxID=1969733 RepID=A0A2K2HCL6_9BACT|nr:c-type cytochrome [Geothermobacter hydrogeniphilus]PNU20993.1 cytochrome c5 family protein [Geothermobacter hydrogeniphilus]
MKKLIMLLAAMTLTLPVAGWAAPNGEAIYHKACSVCHNTGIAGAPQLGNKAAWKERIAEGTDAMTRTAIKGKGAMPARGGHAELSDAEVRAAVEYMMEKGK